MEDKIELMIKRALMHGEVKSQDDVVKIKKLQERIQRKLMISIDYASVRRRVKYILNTKNK